jgi:hypothetical protein
MILVKRLFQLHTEVPKKCLKVYINPFPDRNYVREFFLRDERKSKIGELMFSTTLRGGQMPPQSMVSGKQIAATGTRDPSF